MRNELEIIETIERYLTGQLSPAGRAAFEEQLAADPDLREALRLHQDLLAGIDRITLRAKIENARNRFHARRNFTRWGGLGLGTIVIATVAYILSGPHSLPLNPSAKIYTIDILRDTTLTTQKGAILRIPRGTFDAGADSSLRLAITEAYSISDMLRDGLITRSNGQPLSSGGMIDITSPDGKSIRFLHPIAVSLPTERIQSGMELYKGQADGKGKINWIDPSPLKDSTMPGSLANGKSLYTTYCATCHGTNKKLIGPALAYIGQRRPRKWLYDFIHNNQRVLASGDCFSNALFQYYNKSEMNVFPSLSNHDIDDILAYVDNEGRLTDSNKVPDFKRVYDSCIRYNRMYDSLTELRRALIRGNGSRTTLTYYDTVSTQTIDTSTDTAIVPRPAPVKDTLQGFVTPDEHPSLYYTFTIESFGWYNVDALLKDLPGFEDSELRVHVPAGLTAEVNVFLIIPGRKVIVEGGLLDHSKTDFGFYTSDGHIPLPQGEQAYVLATGEADKKAIFAITQFTMTIQQTIDLRPAPMDKKGINSIISHLDLNQLSIQVDNTPGAGRLRKIDTALASIAAFQPKDCSCMLACGERYPYEDIPLSNTRFGVQPVTVEDTIYTHNPR